MGKDNRKEQSQKPDKNPVDLSKPLSSENEKQMLSTSSSEEKLLESSDTRENNKSHEYEDMLKRLQAEFENYRKRVTKDNELRAKFEGEGLMLKLLPFLDDIDAAIEVAGKSNDAKLKDGMSALRKKLLGILTTDGLNEMKCDGEKFDPHKHEAVLHEASDKEENMIVRVVRKGYLFRDKILRHAMVSVSKGKKN